MRPSLDYLDVETANSDGDEDDDDDDDDADAARAHEPEKVSPFFHDLTLSTPN